MKYYIVAGFVVLAAAAAVWMAKNQAPAVESAHEKWRQTAVEKETAVRPDSFAATKWTTEEAARAPAAAPKK